MSRAKAKSKVTRPAAVCEEKISCASDREIPSIYCRDCGSYQCSNCEEELHKEGESFFHERTKFGQLTDDVSATGNPVVVSKRQTELSGNLPTNPLKLTLNPPKLPNLSEEKKQPRKIVAATTTTTAIASSSSHSATTNCNSPSNCVSSAISKGLHNNIDRNPIDGQSNSNLGKPLRFQPDPELDSLEVEDSDTYHSLGLDSILGSEITDMKGQSSKPSKKAKAKKSCSTLIQEGVTTTTADDHHLACPPSETSHFFSAQSSNGTDLHVDSFDAPYDRTHKEFGVVDQTDDEELVSNLIRSIKSESTPLPLEDVSTRHSAPTNKHSSSRSSRGGQSKPQHQLTDTMNDSRSFLLIDESETIQVQRYRICGVYVTLWNVVIYQCSPLVVLFGLVLTNYSES